METLSNYYDFAQSDLMYASAVFQESKHNPSVYLYAPLLSSLSQAAEKFLKHVIDTSTDFTSIADRDLMRSHSLSRLASRVCEITPLAVSRYDVRWLGEFYFSARYPGDVVFSATAQDVEDAFRIVLEIKRDVDLFRERDKSCRACRRAELKPLRLETAKEGSKLL